MEASSSPDEITAAIALLGLSSSSTSPPSEFGNAKSGEGANQSKNSRRIGLVFGNSKNKPKRWRVKQRRPLNQETADEAPKVGEKTESDKAGLKIRGEEAAKSKGITEAEKVGEKYKLLYEIESMARVADEANFRREREKAMEELRQSQTECERLRREHQSSLHEKDKSSLSS
ncbi:hypothetical protein PanWU01x14_309420 [Parasponia andersonii]|uniref:Uncharacterized protein n=1 Tax=Parasponia andersonii TaxID=3476 RepID=A0A2P5AQN4_PARAD|nr:hypothetical protein PanWU01x14_309420 [Parasponia andersonii]